jgi:rare lipoprotein A
MIKTVKCVLFLLLGFVLLFALSGCSQKKAGYKRSKYTSAARHKATMRTYRVRGRMYQPTYVGVNDTMRGVSSWYGPNFHGKLTSNGETYNMHAMTAAHKTWPMDTMVRVDNLKNGKSVVVRVNDRGPFVSGRVIDCSYAAGKAIGLDKTGIAPVKLTVLGFAGKVYHQSKPKTAPSVSTPAPQLPRVHLSNFAVQVGAFRRYEGAVIYRDRHQTMDASKRVTIKKFIVDATPLYRVWVTGFGSDGEAQDFINDHAVQGGFLIRP